MTQDHDLGLVALAAVICVLACLTTVTLMARAAGARHRHAAGWIVAAGFVFGLGVWSLHFVAMLAYLQSVPVVYLADVTVLSAGIAVLVAVLALAAWHWLPRVRGAAAASGALLGLGVAAMHFTGVAAMRVPGQMVLDMTVVVVSILVAAASGGMALARARPAAGRLSFPRRLEVTGWLTLAICGVHFAGMAAIQIELGAPGAEVGERGAVIASSGLAIAVALTSLLVLLLALAATLMEQHLATRTLREHERMRVLTDMAQEVLVIYRDGHVLEINSAGSRMLGYTAAEIIGQPVMRIFSEHDLPALLRREATPPALRVPEEVALRAWDGRLVPVELSCREIEFSGRPAVALMLRDLSARKRDEARIRHLALHDALTDLPNRTLLQERLSRALQTAGERGHVVGLLYIDLDRFKPVNDLMGHAAGDSLLVQVSARILQSLRPTDTLSRIGGDEFVVVLADAGSPSRVSVAAGRLVESLAQPFDIQGRQVEIGGSIGVSMYPGDGADSDKLLRAADTALYRAKEQGRGMVRFYEASMDTDLRERQALERDLRHAVERGEMELFYQPLQSCRTGQIEGFEALLRWRHPVRGLLGPATFITMAEETGLIGPIGAWVVETACAAAAAWPEPWWVAVNISPVQFRQGNLVSQVGATLARTGLPPARLEVEVTESVLIGDTAQALQVLSQLRGLGVRLSLDDFGTGYSSLSYLRTFAFDKIKIDRSFVKDLGRNEEATMIVKAIIALGHNLGLAITAEGVETQEQLEMLKAQGSDQVQGYLIGRPEEAGRIGQYLHWDETLLPLSFQQAS